MVFENWFNSYSLVWSHFDFTARKEVFVFRHKYAEGRERPIKGKLSQDTKTAVPEVFRYFSKVRRTRPNLFAQDKDLCEE